MLRSNEASRRWRLIGGPATNWSILRRWFVHHRLVRPLPDWKGIPPPPPPLLPAFHQSKESSKERNWRTERWKQTNKTQENGANKETMKLSRISLLNGIWHRWNLCRWPRISDPRSLISATGMTLGLMEAILVRTEGGGRRGERSQFVPLVNSVELLTIARRWAELCKKTRLGPEDRLESQ